MDRFGRVPGHGRQSAFSLVELMVGVAVGLIGILAIMRAFEFNEQFKRSTGGTGQAQSNGAIALHNLEREIRMSGYGFNAPSALDCGKVYWHYSGAYSTPPAAPGVNALPDIVMAPVQITDGGVAGSDTITVTYGNPANRVIPARTSGLPLNTTSIRVDDAAGFVVNNMVLVAQAAPCMIYNVTDPVALQPDVVQKTSGAVGPFNPAGNALFPAYVDGANVYDLGQLTVSRFSINANDLQLVPLFRIAPSGLSAIDNQPQVLVNDIVAMKAWYGKDLAGSDGVIDAWDKTTPTNSAGWSAVRAIRVVLLARSGNYEKPAVAGACDATPAGSETIKYFDPATPAQISPNPGPFTLPGTDPLCYRYKRFETVIPLRNMIWRQS